jgi:hypothetical protein
MESSIVKKYLKKSERCIIFVNDTPKVPDEGLEAGLRAAESKNWYVVGHWRTRQNKKFRRPKNVFKRMYDFAVQHREVKHVLLVNCEQDKHPWLADLVSDLSIVYDKNIELLLQQINPDDEFA